MLSFSQFIQEKLIVLNGGAPYGQIVFLAGGGGSGKGFASANFMEINKFKVRDVDAMKAAFLELNRIYTEIKNLPDDPNSKEVAFDHGPLSHTLKVPVSKQPIKVGNTHYGDRQSNPYAVLKNMNLRNPGDVFKLHDFVDYLGIKDKTLLALMQSAKQGSGHLPNIVFDITAKNVKSIEKVITGDGKIPGLIDIGYQPTAIHLIWILADYAVAVERNAKRSRVVPDDIMLTTHEGAATTMFDVLRGKIPHGMDGGVYVVLNRDLKPEDMNQSKNTASTSAVSKFKPSPGVKDFTYIRYKAPGKGIEGKEEIQKQIYQWIIQNIPKTAATAHIFDAGKI